MKFLSRGGSLTGDYFCINDVEMFDLEETGVIVWLLLPNSHKLLDL